jgi:hypothetical protein
MPPLSSSGKSRHQLRCFTCLLIHHSLSFLNLCGGYIHRATRSPLFLTMISNDAIHYSFTMALSVYLSSCMNLADLDLGCQTCFTTFFQGVLNYGFRE